MITPQKYVLGLNLGPSFLAWAMIALDEADCPTSLIRTGVRMFEPGVAGTSLDIQLGKDQSKAIDRSIARLNRRRLRRRAARQRELFLELQRRGLLPVAGNEGGPNAKIRHELLNALDQELIRKYFVPDDCSQSFAQLPLYRLRKRALKDPLERFELGRILYHLIHRRGFKSNRKERERDTQDEHQGKVKADIALLAAEIQAAGAPTLGAYLAGLNPHQQKVRRRWTARDMYEHEFAAIWAAQAPYHPTLLTPELRERITHLLFYQRPIPSQKHLIGACELERGDATHPPQKRAPWASMAAQRFGILQAVNDLKLIAPNTNAISSLSPEDKAELYELLDRRGTQSFAKIRAHLGIPKGWFFDAEKNGSKGLQGNRTQMSMLKIFGLRWFEFSQGKQDQIVENWRNCESDESLKREAREHLGLDDAGIEQFISENPAPNYYALSLKAISKLTPGMLAGRSLDEVKREVYGDRFSGIPIHKKLPQVRDILPGLRNPALERAMTELRKVVNAIVCEHGKPYEIRVELASSLKKARGRRQKDTNKNQKREKERIQIASKLSQELGVEHPGKRLIEKAILHRECGGICPYSGQQIPYISLINDAEFNIEYIVPRSRFPDSSFQNRMLCHESVRQLKGNQTVWEMFQGKPEEYQKLLDRVRAWPIQNHGKLERFRIGEPDMRDDNTLESFSARKLNDTGYTSLTVAKLLATLYGGREVLTPDGGMRTTVHTSSGFLTAALRNAWGLQEILHRLVAPQPGDTRGKPLTDHRHHAIDAITIASLRPSAIVAMARASQRRVDIETSSRIEQPWSHFVSSIQPQIDQLLISHRPKHKLSGELHDKTYYSPPVSLNQVTTVHVRKRVSGLTPRDLVNIVDSAVRRSVIAKATELGGDLSSCELNEDWPELSKRNGDAVPIKKVRIRKVLNVTPIGSGTTRRYVAENNNHHIAIYAQLDEHGQEKRWEAVIVSMLEAYQRASAAKKSGAYEKRQPLPIVQRSMLGRDHLKFKFSLMGGDTIELHRICVHEESVCTPEIYRIRTIATSGQLSLSKINDARMKKEIIAAGDWWQPRVDALRKLYCRKVVIDLYGRKRYAND